MPAALVKWDPDVQQESFITFFPAGVEKGGRFFSTFGGTTKNNAIIDFPVFPGLTNDHSAPALWLAKNHPDSFILEPCGPTQVAPQFKTAPGMCNNVGTRSQLLVKNGQNIEVINSLMAISNSVNEIDAAAIEQQEVANIKAAERLRSQAGAILRRGREVAAEELTGSTADQIFAASKADSVKDLRSQLGGLKTPEQVQAERSQVSIGNQGGPGAGSLISLAVIAAALASSR